MTEIRDQHVSSDEKGVSGGVLYIQSMAFVVFCIHLVLIFFLTTDIYFKFLSDFQIILIPASTN